MHPPNLPGEECTGCVMGTEANWPREWDTSRSANQPWRGVKPWLNDGVNNSQRDGGMPQGVDDGSSGVGTFNWGEIKGQCGKRGAKD